MSGDRALRGRVRRAGLAGCLALLTAVLTVVVTGYSGVWAAFTATTASTGSQLMTRAAFPDYRTAVTESGPVVYHPFDDAYGSSAAAAVAGTTGTYNGAAAPSSISPGGIASSSTRKAVSFPEGTYADATSTSTLTGSPLKVSLEAWVRTGHGGAVVSLLPPTGTAAPGGIQLYVNALGEACVGLTLQFQALQRVCGSDSTDTKVWTSTDQASPAWHQIVAVVDPSGAADTASTSTDGTQVMVYVDGGIVFDRGLTGTWPSSAVTGQVRVGSTPVTAGPAPATWSGDIDEVALYAGALTAAQVQTHYTESKDINNANTPTTYGQAVTSSSPVLWWRLEETPGPAARSVANAVTGSATGTFHAYPDLPVTGAPTGSAAAALGVGLSGLDDISTGASRTTPAAFSTEVWFSSTGGTGPLVSFGDTRTGLSTIPYGAVYLTAQGTLAFSIRSPQRTVASGQDYRGTGWHLVTATMSTAGRMRLYVDGTLVGEDTSSTTTGTSTGFWRWGGGGDYSAFTTKPGATFFTGSLDEGSVYDRELTAEDVAIHWGARL